MNEQSSRQDSARRVSGYGLGDVDTVLSVDDVNSAVEQVGHDSPSTEALSQLTNSDSPLVSIDGLGAGYGRMQILRDISLRLGQGQSLCLIGPNGAGKSTVLHSIYGFTRIMAGSIRVDGRDVTRLAANDKLSDVGVAYILQDNSVFPDMTVEENLLMGGFLMASPKRAKQAADKVFDRYDRLAQRRSQRAGVLSGGERRLLEIARALIMEPSILLVDEPSIGLEPRYIDMVFDILHDLQHEQGKTILMVEQNAKKGLEFADIGYVLVAGQLAMADTGDQLLEDPEVGRLFLGG